MWVILAELTAREGLIRIGVLFAAIAVLTGLGALVVARFRGGEENDQPPASELLTKFRELHEQGKLSDAEFRNIKTQLAAPLQKELSDTSEQG